MIKLRIVTLIRVQQGDEIEYILFANFLVPGYFNNQLSMLLCEHSLCKLFSFDTLFAVSELK